MRRSRWQRCQRKRRSAGVAFTATVPFARSPRSDLNLSPLLFSGSFFAARLESLAPFRARKITRPAVPFARSFPGFWTKKLAVRRRASLFRRRRARERSPISILLSPRFPLFLRRFSGFSSFAWKTKALPDRQCATPARRDLPPLFLSSGSAPKPPNSAGVRPNESRRHGRERRDGISGSAAR